MPRPPSASTKTALKKQGSARKTVLAAAAPGSPLLVGVGASAGGLASLTRLLKALPGNANLSLIIVQHMDPQKASGLASLLAQKSSLPVLEVQNGMAVEPGRVYVVPPGHDVWLKEQAFGIELREKRAALDGQVDKFLCSLAEVGGARAVAVILSGTGNDGTEGARAIRDRGGLVFAESHASAKHYGMPSSAILAHAVDHVLSADTIARSLVRLARGESPGFPLSKKAVKPADLQEQSLLKEIFGILNHQRKVNFSDYKPSTLRRRIARRVGMRRAGGLEEYLHILRQEPQEVDDLFRDLLINVTGFFRDPQLFRGLCKEVLPEIIRGKREGGSVRVWVPGCATGEEVYSIGICLSEVLAKMKCDLKVQIFGTDLSDWAIIRARSGLYSAEALRTVSAERKRRFFEQIEGNYRIRRSIREMCTFAQQNLCQDPPFSHVDLISCRNVMIYLGPNLQRKCVPLFYYALNPQGYLLLGISESIGSFADLFTLVDKKNKIYRKKSTHQPIDRPARAPALPEAQTAPEPPRNLSLKASAMRTEKDTALELQMAADHLILTHFAPCGVVIDTRMQVWHFRGYTAAFLEHTPGTASLNILKLVRHALAPDLSAAIHQALKTGAGVRKECLIGGGEAQARAVSIEVVPFSIGVSPEQWLLVIFDDVPTAVPLPLPGDDEGAELASVYAREVERLRSELAATKESLQCIIEEQEAANEEIKSANEEIESSNEELQSTNEELETAKEELQSTNDELSSVNDELNQRNHEINEINSDLNNLLSSINLAIVMVDNNLTIRRTTPLAQKLFNIIPTDIGRKLKDINPNIEMPMLPKMIRSVLENLAPCEETVADADGQAYSLRVRPYRTLENVINGVVITLVDISRPSKRQTPTDSKS